jgi:hypothetical protein
MKLASMFLLAGFLTVTANHAAHAGQEGKGGNLMGIQFSVTGDNIVSAIEKLGPSQFPGLDIAKLRDSVNTTSVYMTDESLPGDPSPEEICDSGTKKITVSENAWLHLYDNAQGKLYLVLHGYLNVSSLESSDSYTRTGLILSRLQRAGVDLTSLLATDIPNPLDFSGSWDCDSRMAYVSKLILSGKEVYRFSFGELIGGYSAFMEYTATLDLNQVKQPSNVLAAHLVTHNSSGGFFKLEIGSKRSFRITYDRFDINSGSWEQKPVSLDCSR